MNNLGVLVSRVEARIQEETDFYNDPITRQSGCADEFAPSRNRRLREDLRELVRSAGFRSFQDFVSVVALRTTDRWVYFNTMLNYVDPDCSL